MTFFNTTINTAQLHVFVKFHKHSTYVNTERFERAITKTTGSCAFVLLRAGSCCWNILARPTDNIK